MFNSLEKFCESLKSNLLSRSFNVMLAADNDLDGLFSAVKLDLGLYEVFDLEVETSFREELRWEIPLYYNFDILIMLDLAYDNTPNYRKAASKASYASYAIDHHVTQEIGFPQKVIAYNPCRKGDCYEPTTFLVNEVIKKFGKIITDLDVYLSLLGVLADAGINFKVNNGEINYFYNQRLKDLYFNSFNSYDYMFKSIKYKNYVYPYFKEIIEALNCEGLDVGWKELYLRFINEATDVNAAQHIVNGILKKHEGKYQDLIDLIPTEPSEITESGIWIIRNTTNIGNGVLGRLVSELFNEACIVYSCKTICRISARAPPESNINFIPLFTGFGGGHTKACGALLNQNRFQTFYEEAMKF